MASTPPPVALRAHTPPTPLKGPRYDNYEPYSPRRSKRSTAQNNPYSSLNSDRSPHSTFSRSTPPPTVNKKARFVRAPTQLSSPPSSPASPRKQLHKTPRKSTPASHSRSKPFTTTVHSDSDAGPSNSSLAPSTIDPITMLPTPSKTPNKKRPHAAALTHAARILSFQPNHPNDVMPSPRKIKKSAHRSHSSRTGFELYDDDMGNLEGESSIEIYTDANARVPVLDQSEDNPFVGARNKGGVRPQRRSRRTSADAEMEGRAERGEGVVYVFRGKKIFKPFEEPDAEGEDTTNPPDPDQRRLRHAAGPAAQRPLTRSTIKPRLLFPSAEQQAERERGPDDVDEEAVTDIEMDNASDPTAAKAGTLANDNASLVSPPLTLHKKKGRSVRATIEFTPVPVEEDGEPMALGTDESFEPASASGPKGKGKSPFDAWKRTKGGRKRAGEASEEGEGSAKRTRSGAASFEESAML